MEKLRKDPNAACKEQIAKIKKDLPKNVRVLVCEEFPEYNTKVGAKLLDNVLSGSSADLRLTEILKKFAFINTQVTQIQIPS